MNQNYNFVQGLFSQVMNGKNEALATKNSTSFKGFLLMIVFALFANMSVQGQITVTVTNPSNTTPNLAASYTTLASALTDLNAVTAMSGPVVLTLGSGTSETAPIKGFVIGSSTLNPLLSASNTLTINKSGANAVTINAGVGTSNGPSASPDGMLYLNGADYVTIDGLTFTDNNSADATVAMEFGVAMFKRSAGDGCNNNTIQNCTFNMQRINNASGTAPMVDGSVGILVINSTAAAAVTVLTPTNGGTLATNGTNSNNKFYGNIINGGNIGIALSGFAATTGVGSTPISTSFLGDLNNDIGGSGSMTATTGNSIINYGGGAISNPAAGIRVNNQWSVNVSNNIVNNNNGSGANHATTLRGIFLQAGTSANVTCTYNTVSIKGGGTTSSLTAIDNAIGGTALSNIVNINYNTVQNCTYATATTGSFTCISNSASAATVNINNNTIQNNSVVGAATSSVFTGIVNSGSTGTTLNIQNNLISGISLSSTGTCPFISVGSPGGTANVTNNTVQAITNAGVSGTMRAIIASTPVGLYTCTGNTIQNLSYSTATSTGSIDGIYNLASATLQSWNSNIIRNLSTPSTGTIRGMHNNTVTGTFNMNNNQIYGFSTTIGGAGGATFTGISSSNGAVTISGNTIYSLNSSGTTGGAGGVITGILNGAGTTASIFGNKIYDLSSTSTNPTVAGITLSGGTTNTVYNNIIGDLRATAANAANAVIGINVSGGTTANVYYNTVRLAASSTGALFGSSALSASTTPTLDLRNNILVNASTVNGAGLAVAYRRASTTLTSYATTSNNNLFFGTSAVFTDGTNTDLGLAAFQTRVAPRDTASKSQNPTFASTTGSATTFLHFTAGDANLAGDNGATIAGFTTDFDGDTRTSTPDIGADEWANGIIAPPTISNFTTAFSSVAPITLCQDGGQTVTITGTNLGTATSVLFNGSTGINLAGTITATTSTSITVTTPAGLVAGNIRVINPAGQGDSAYVYTTAGSPTVGVTSNLSACAAVGTTLTATGAATYTWTPSTALSATTGASVIASPTTNTTYTVRGTDSNGCAVTNTVTITVLPTPSAIAITSAPSSICAGGVATLVATGGSIPVAQTILSENFNAGIGTFTSTTLSSSAIQNWAPQANGYLSHTGSVSGFMMANSDIGGSGSTANTQLISPSFSTVGFNNLSLNFKEYLNNSNTAAAVEISDDNFVTSTILRNNITNDIGTASVFNNTTIAIPELFNNKANVKIRFRFEGSYSWYWSVDEIVISGNPLQPISWTSASSLFTDAAATSAYTNQDIRTVYSTVSGSQNYTATATAANGCSSTTTVTVNPLPLPSAPTAIGSSQCGARVPTATVAATSGAAGTGTFKWYDQATGGTPIQSSTSASLTTYSVSATTTLYVSELGTNGCESLRTPVTITVGAAPALTISAAPSAICSGASTTTPVTITSTLADFNEYTWAPTTGVTGTASAGYTFNPTATTNYVLSSLNTTTGCTNLANLTVNVNPLPVITSATTSVEPLCLGSSTTLTALSIASAPGNATVGAGLTTGTTYDAIFYHFYGGNKTQQLVTAAELRAAGLGAGNITRLGIVIASGGGTYAGLAINIAPTTNTNMSAGINSTATFTPVYNIASYSTTTGTNTFNFSTPFVWDGVSNIIVQFCWSNNNGGGTSNYAKGDTTSFVSTAYFRADSNTPAAICSGTTATGTTSFRPQFIFGGQIANDISSSLNWSWSPAATLSAATGNVVTATPTASTVYTVTATNSTTSCSNTRTVGVTLLPTLASAPTATDSTHCGLQLSTATVTSTTTTVNPVFVWYTVATGGTSVQSGPSRTFLTAVNSTRTMYVAEVGPNGCESLRTPVVMTVTAPPTLSITSSVPTFCGTGGNTTLTAVSNDSAMTYTWTSFTPSATISALNTSVVTASISETSEFKVVGIAANPSCLPIESFISVGVYPLPSATVTTTAQGLCPGTSATIGSGLSAGNFTAACIPAPSAPATSPLGAVSLVGGGALLTPYPAGVFENPFGFGSLDDNFWGGIPVGFNFNFFGNTVTNVFIGSNGTINLGTTGSTAFTFSGFPSTLSPASTIAVVARDLHWARTGSGKITYWTEGVAPNRRFIVQFLNATTYGTDFTTGNPNGKQTAEAVFYETLGTIDIRVFEATFTNAKYIGLQDATQTIGASAPNCSATPNTPNYWNGVTAEIPASAPRAWRFTPPSNYATTWYADGVAMPSVAANPTATPPVVGYTNPGTNVFSIPVAPLATTTYSISYTNLTSGCSNAPGSAQVVMGVLGNVAPVGVNTIVNNSTICLGQSVDFSTSYTGLTDGIVFQWQNSIDGGTTWNDIASATSLTLTHTPLAPSKYRLKMVACNGVPGYTSEAPIGFFNNVVSSTPAVRCGVGTASLSAAGSSGTTIKWYANPSGGTSLGTGTTFTTPSINTNTTYYAGAESFAAGSIAIGAGGTNSATSGRSFLPGAWGGSKTQYIIKASELLAAGIGAGNITSLGFETTNSGQTYQGFSVSLAPVTADVMTTAFVSTGLTRVYTGTQADNGFTPVANTLNTLTFGTGTGSASSFNWDGSSNILISISRSSVPNATTSISTTMKVDDVGFVSTAYDLADNLDPATMLASTTADATTSFRPRFTINGQIVCSSSRVAVPVTVTPPPAITLSGNPATICAESNSTPVTVTAGASDYSSYVWTPTTVTGNATTGWVFNPLTTTTYTLLASQTTGATPCANNATVTVTVNPTPSVLTIAPVSTCANAITPIVSTGGTLDNMTLLTQNFNGPSNWTTVNNSTGGSAGPAVANWTLQSSGYVYSFYGPFASNDNSQFYMTNSDAQGSGGTTSTELRSPVFSTVGFTAANLSFFHHLYFPTTGNVEYTTNGGTTWTTIQSYTTSQGTATAFANANLALPAAMLNQPSVQLRFKYDDSWGYFWLIDNVSITGTQVATMVWSPTTNLYTDAAATIPYTGQNLSTVYFKNTSAASSVNYTATATSMLGCARVATVPVVVYQTAAPTGLQFFQFCPSGGATVGTMSPALIGTNIKWYSVSTGGTALAPTTPLSQGYYWASQTANGCESPTRFLVFAISNATAAPSSSPSQQFCNSATVANLTANGASLQWYSAATGGTALSSTTALSTGTYYVSQTSGGCESPRTAVSVTVTSVPAPTGAATQSLSSLLTLGDIVVTGSNITWYASAADAASGTNPLASTQLLANTTYYATQTINGCRSAASLAVTITTLANQDFDMTQFTYYPNPVIDLLNITYSQDMTSVKVFNMIGQQLMSKQVNSNTIQVDMSSYANGAYFIQVTTENAMKTVRVIKK
jgi:hypothetical protein